MSLLLKGQEFSKKIFKKFIIFFINKLN